MDKSADKEVREQETAPDGEGLEWYKGKLPVDNVTVHFKNGGPVLFWFWRWHPYRLCKGKGSHYWFKESRWDLFYKLLAAGSGDMIISVNKAPVKEDDFERMTVRFSYSHPALLKSGEARYRVADRDYSEEEGLSPEEQLFKQLDMSQQRHMLKQREAQEERRDV